MNNSNEIKNVSQSLVKASAEIKNMIPDSAGYGYNFTSLGCILDQVKPIIAKYGLCIIQAPSHSDKGIGVETIILHESGEYLQFNYDIPLTDDLKRANATQKAGSAISYGRRYALSAVFGIATELDTDGVNKKDDMPSKQDQPKVRSLDNVYEKISLMVVPSEIDAKIKDVKESLLYNAEEKKLITAKLNERLLKIQGV